MLFFPHCYPRNKFHPNRMKNTEVQTFDILEKIFFQKFAKTKLVELERFTWSHQIRKYQIYFGYKFRPRPQAAPDVPQVPQTFARKNGKPSISRMAQKIELIIRLFSGQKALVKIHYRSALMGQLGRSKNSHRPFKQPQTFQIHSMLIFAQCCPP